jgi:hypothetical protein
MTALLATGDFSMSEDFKRLGREQPELWQELRAFFGRKEFTTAALALADQPRPRAD